MDDFKRILDEDFFVKVIGKTIFTLSSILPFFLVLILFLTFYTVSFNPTLSMYPTIEEGSMIIGSKFYKELKRGDMVVIEHYASGEFLNKRILGLPGEKIEIKEMTVYIDGIEYDDPYKADKEWSDDLTIHLKTDEYFVVGDNRDDSLDSRIFGPITKNEIISKIIKIVDIWKLFE